MDEVFGFQDLAMDGTMERIVFTAKELDGEYIYKRPGHKRPGHKRPGHKRPDHKRPPTIFFKGWVVFFRPYPARRSITARCYLGLLGCCRGRGEGGGGPFGSHLPGTAFRNTD